MAGASDIDIVRSHLNRRHTCSIRKCLRQRCRRQRQKMQASQYENVIVIMKNANYQMFDGNGDLIVFFFFFYYISTVVEIILEYFQQSYIFNVIYYNVIRNKIISKSQYVLSQYVLSHLITWSATYCIDILDIIAKKLTYQSY